MRRRKRSSGTYKIVFCYDIIYYSAACSLVPILTDCHYTLYRAYTALGTVTYPPPPPPLRPLLLQINKETASHAAPASATFIPHTQKTRVCVCVSLFSLSLTTALRDGRKRGNIENTGGSIPTTANLQTNTRGETYI